MKVLDHKSLPQAMQCCCSTGDGTEDMVRRRGLELLHEELRKKEVKMGAGAEDAHRHMQAAQERAKERLLREAQDPRCGFPILAAFTIIGFLLNLWRAFHEWQRT